MDINNAQNSWKWVLLSHSHTPRATAALLQKQWICVPLCLWNFWWLDKYIYDYVLVKQKCMCYHRHLVFSFRTTQWHTQCWKLLELMKKIREYQLYFLPVEYVTSRVAPLIVFWFSVFFYFNSIHTFDLCILYRSFTEILYRNSALLVCIFWYWNLVEIFFI